MNELTPRRRIELVRTVRCSKRFACRHRKLITLIPVIQTALALSTDANGSESVKDSTSSIALFQQSGNTQAADRQKCCPGDNLQRRYDSEEIMVDPLQDQNV